MAEERFEAFVRGVSHGATRRHLLGLLAGAVGLAASTPSTVEGRHHHHHHRHHHHHQKHEYECALAWSYDPLTRQPDLSGRNLVGCNLSGADLAFANLTDAKLTYADLPAANLTDADLQRAELKEVDLRSANLTDANLSYAFLMFANLANATLARARLDFAVLWYANLRGARGLREIDLDGARWGYTTCPDGTNSNNNGGTCVGHLIP